MSRNPSVNGSRESNRGVVRAKQPNKGEKTLGIAALEDKRKTLM